MNGNSSFMCHEKNASGTPTVYFATNKSVVLILFGLVILLILLLVLGFGIMGHTLAELREQRDIIAESYLIPRRLVMDNPECANDLVRALGISNIHAIVDSSTIDS